MKYIRKVLASVRKADEQFSLIHQGDKILVGVSGGKDSLCLLYALHLYRKFSRKNFRIVPAMLDLGFDGFDPSPVQEWARTLGYELVVSDAKEVYPILKANQKEGHHLPCSICSRMKKAAINDLAHTLHCKKVAFAHHKDDAIETLLMNMIHGGKVATFEPFMHLDRADITFLRPFILCKESDLIGMAKEENLPVMGRTCPADGYTERQYCKELLSRLYEERPESEKNFMDMLSDYQGFHLYFSHLSFLAEYCQDYGFHPLLTAKDLASYLSLAKKHRELGTAHLEEESYLILKKGKIVGRLAFRRISAHQIDIFAFDLLNSEIDKKAALLSSFCFFESRKANPLAFHYLPRLDIGAKEAGFATRKIGNKVYKEKKIIK